MTAADRVRAFTDAWEGDGRGPAMYRGYGRTAETDNPADRLTVADLRELIEQADRAPTAGDPRGPAAGVHP